MQKSILSKEIINSELHVALEKKININT